MKFARLLVAVVGLGGAAPLLAHNVNPLLQYTMKALAKDTEEVGAPARFPDPADVLDAVILNAVARARTANFALDLVKQRRGGEMEPGGFDELPPAQRLAKQELLATHLQRAIDKLNECEQILLVQFAKDAEQRDFRALKTRLSELEAIIVEAHRLFRP